MIHFLKLIHWKNLALMAIVQLLIKYALFPAFGVSITLNHMGFSLLVFSSLCIAAGGYIINAIYSLEAHKINKPDAVIIDTHISEKTANTLYLVLTSIGVFIGFYLSHVVGKSTFFVMFIIASALPYLYASYLKEIPVVGTILISALISLSIIIVGIFELIPAITTENRSVQSTMFEVLCDYAIFIFIIHFIREFIKDIISINGDHKVGLKTLPVILGKQRTSKIAFILTLLTAIGVVIYISSYLYMHTDAILYFLIAVIGPLLYVSIKLFLAESNQQFLHCILVLKIIILTGMLSMLLYRFIF